VSGDNTALNGSDYIVVKAVNVDSDTVAHTWTRLGPGTTTRNGLSGTRFNNGDHAVVYDPSDQSLVVQSGSFDLTWPNTSAFAPTGSTYLVLGVSSTTLRMPYNRADYYITNGTSPYATGTSVPARCAPGTGVLVKAQVRHADGALNELPLLGCVVDMQAIYRLDTDGDGSIDTNSEDISGLTASAIRTQLREVRLYILAHEGQRDPDFTYPNASVYVGEFGLGRVFSLSSNVTDYQAYRWKLYTLVVRPETLK